MSIEDIFLANTSLKVRFHFTPEMERYVTAFTDTFDELSNSVCFRVRELKQGEKAEYFLFTDSTRQLSVILTPLLYRCLPIFFLNILPTVQSVWMTKYQNDELKVYKHGAL